MSKTLKNQVYITTAHQLSLEQKRVLEQLIITKLGQNFTIIETVDPNLIGGINIKIGEQTFDLTIAGQLKKIQAQTPIIEVASPYGLSSTQKDKLQKGLTKKYGSELLIKEIIDPSLVAGLRIRINDREYDGSIKGQLTKLHQQLKTSL